MTRPELTAEGKRLGDSDFDDLYRQLWPQLVRLALLLLGSAGDAEDAVQDSFIATYARWSTMRDRDGAARYLRRAVVNQSRSRLRSRGAQTRALHRVTPSQNAPGSDVPVLADEQETAVLRALAAMPHRQREVLVLRYWGGLSEAEIAAVLRISRGTVKSSASRGLRLLATMVGELHEH